MCVQEEDEEAAKGEEDKDAIVQRGSERLNKIKKLDSKSADKPVASEKSWKNRQEKP